MPVINKWFLVIASSATLAVASWTYAQGQKLAALEAQAEAQQTAITVMAANTQADMREIRASLESIRQALLRHAEQK